MQSHVVQGMRIAPRVGFCPRTNAEWVARALLVHVFRARKKPTRMAM